MECVKSVNDEVRGGVKFCAFDISAKAMRLRQIFRSVGPVQIERTQVRLRQTAIRSRLVPPIFHILSRFACETMVSVRRSYDLRKSRNIFLSGSSSLPAFLFSENVYGS